MLIEGNDWSRLVDLLPPEDRLSLTVTVVVPAHGRQDELDACLAALQSQSYPASLLDVVVVDDGSEPPLRLPADPTGEARVTTRLVRVEPEDSSGNGGARRTGAQAAQGEVVLFVDSDIVCGRRHVTAHARWHHLGQDLMVLGARRFADIVAPSPDEVRRAVAEDRLWDLAGDSPLEGHSWVERHFERSDRLRAPGYDGWLPVVGASVSVHRDLYEAAGGFPAVDRRGVVDTLFGFRAWTAGAVVVPEPEAESLHLGRRSFDARGEELKALRAPVLAALLPDHRFRPAVAGRAWQVPLTHVAVDAVGCGFDEVRTTVDSLLTGSASDITIAVHETAGEARRQVEEYWAGESRVGLVDSPAAPLRPHPSPYGLLLRAGVSAGPEALATMLRSLVERGDGLLRVVLDDDVAAELWLTRALHRAAGAVRDGTPSIDAVRTCFGEHAVAGGSVGLSRDAVTAPLRAPDAAALVQPGARPVGEPPSRPALVSVVPPVGEVAPTVPADQQPAEQPATAAPGRLRLAAYRVRTRLAGR